MGTAKFSQPPRLIPRDFFSGNNFWRVSADSVELLLVSFSKRTAPVAVLSLSSLPQDDSATSSLGNGISPTPKLLLDFRDLKATSSHQMSPLWLVRRPRVLLSYPERSCSRCGEQNFRFYTKICTAFRFRFWVKNQAGKTNPVDFLMCCCAATLLIFLILRIDAEQRVDLCNESELACFCVISFVMSCGTQYKHLHLFSNNSCHTTFSSSNNTNE